MATTDETLWDESDKRDRYVNPPGNRMSIGWVQLEWLESEGCWVNDPGGYSDVVFGSLGHARRAGWGIAWERPIAAQPTVVELPGGFTDSIVADYQRASTLANLSGAVPAKVSKTYFSFTTNNKEN